MRHNYRRVNENKVKSYQDSEHYDDNETMARCGYKQKKCLRAKGQMYRDRCKFEYAQSAEEQGQCRAHSLYDENAQQKQRRDCQERDTDAYAQRLLEVLTHMQVDD